jgi:prevent-host-death family protein
VEVNIHQAKTHLSRLLQRVAAGEEVTIARSGVPVARLVAVEPKKATRPLGFARGQIWIADDFDAPLPDDLLKLFHGGELPPTIESAPSPKKSSRKRK